MQDISRVNLAGLDVRTRGEVIKRFVVEKGCHLICLGVVYLLAQMVRVEDKTTEEERKQTIMAMLAFNVQMIVFGAIFLLYTNIVTLLTSSQGTARKVNMIVLYFVLLPIAFCYFYFTNWSIIQVIFEDSKLPEAKSSSSLLAIIYFIFAINALFSFLFMTLALVIIIGGLIYAASEAYKDYKERDMMAARSSNIVSQLTTRVSKIFGDNMCVVCTEEFKSEDLIVQLHCHKSHIFHASCIEKCLNSGNNLCPLCRAPIV